MTVHVVIRPLKGIEGPKGLLKTLTEAQHAPS